MRADSNSTIVEEGALWFWVNDAGTVFERQMAIDTALDMVRRTNRREHLHHAE